jgi:hypothetical protein
VTADDNAMLDEIKQSLRLSNTDFDTEIGGLIDEARADMIEAGIPSTFVNDPADLLIKRAIRTYCRAEFGLNNPNAEALKASDRSLVVHLMTSADYAEEE